MGKVSDFRPCSGSFVDTNGFVCVFFFVGRWCTTTRTGAVHDDPVISASRCRVGVTVKSFPTSSSGVWFPL